MRERYFNFSFCFFFNFSKYIMFFCIERQLLISKTNKKLKRNSSFYSVLFPSKAMLFIQAFPALFLLPVLRFKLLFWRGSCAGSTFSFQIYDLCLEGLMCQLNLLFLGYVAACCCHLLSSGCFLLNCPWSPSRQQYCFCSLFLFVCLF